MATILLHAIDGEIELVDRLLRAAEQVENEAAGVEQFGSCFPLAADGRVDVDERLRQVAADERADVGPMIEGLWITGRGKIDDNLRVGQGRGGRRGRCLPGRESGSPHQAAP